MNTAPASALYSVFRKKNYTWPFVKWSKLEAVFDKIVRYKEREFQTQRKSKQKLDLFPFKSWERLSKTWIQRQRNRLWGTKVIEKSSDKAMYFIPGTTVALSGWVSHANFLLRASIMEKGWVSHKTKAKLLVGKQVFMISMPRMRRSLKMHAFASILRRKSTYFFVGTRLSFN